MKVIQKNKKATFDYEIIETFMAGIMLTGPEVKSVRAGNVNLKGSYISIEHTIPKIKGMHISEYNFAKDQTQKPLRARQLLLTEKELHKIEKALNTQGVAAVPLAIGLKGRFIKLEFALGRGKKKHDKRHDIKEKSMKRAAEKALKYR